MSRQFQLSILVLLATFFSACATAEDDAQNASGELPTAVRAALETSQEGIEVRRMQVEIDATGRGTIYRFEFEDMNRIRYEFDITEQGEILRSTEEGQLSFRDGLLHREEEPFWIQSIYEPSGADPDRYPAEFRKSVYSLSDVGGNTLAFDLVGLSKDGSSFAPEALDHLHNVVVELLEYSMSGICRVLGTKTGEEPEWRRAAVRTVAEALRSEPQLLYWIDGEDASDLVAEFKLLAPELVVAGPGGDLSVTDGPDSNPATLALVQFPQFQPGTSHLLLQNRVENLEFLDQKNRFPAEFEPWLYDDVGLPDDERRDRFKPMFDGKTLKGWTSIRKGKTSFVARDGVIEWVRKGAGAIQFHRRFSNFVLRFEYKIAEGGNSGVHLRSPRANRASRIGFEVQLLGDYGERPDKGSTGAIYSVVAPKENASKPAGEWNSVEVAANGSLVKVTLNEKVVQNVNFDSYPELKDRLRRGFIRLTDHGDYVAFRNIRIKEL